MQSRMREMPEEVSRLFIGIRPDARTQQFLDGLTSQAKRELGPDKRDRIRWTSHANRHLTLAFLGETPDALIPRIEAKLAQIADKLPPFCARVVSLNPFPQRRSSLLAAELLTNPDLDKLHQQCRELMMELSMKPEGASYRPHITLARNRRGFARLEPVMLDYTMPLNNLVLYQSHMAPGGSQYLPLFEALLEDAQP